MQQISGYVYLMRPIGSHMVYKIGRTTDLERRLITINRHLDHKLEYVFSLYVKDYDQAEQWLHRKFKSCHLSGEWFVLDDNEVTWIKSLTSI